jgi:membrane protein DedA with SNARE-associated domain
VNFEQIVADYGQFIYLIIFVWTFLEGETFVLFAGLAAHLGYLDFWGVLLCAWFGSFLGDQLYYWIGRSYGERLLVRLPRWRPGVNSALAWLRQYNTWFILSFRFIYGVRQFSSFAVGMSGVGPVRFLALNFTAAGMWALTFTGVGFVCGEALEAVLGDLALTFGLAMLAAFAFAICMVSLANRRSQRRNATLPGATATVVPVISAAREDRPIR